MVVTTDRDDVLRLPKPPPRWWLRAGIAAAVVCALVSGGLWAHEYFLVRCADGVYRTGRYDECIGVTDGAHHFDDRLADVIGRIHEENQWVEENATDWVGVAYFEPMTLGKGDKGWASIEQELQGAYLAQHEWNQTGKRPRMKLLLANPGRGLEQWRTVVQQIRTMTGGAHPVVAVAGFGQSRDTTKKAVEALRKAEIPMVGSTVTADGLSKKGEPVFFRAVSPNSVQAEAVVRYLEKRQKARPGLTVRVVKDINYDDIYSRSLVEGFIDAVRDSGGGLHVDPLKLQFISKEQGVHNALDSVAEKVCAASRRDDGPDAVYFAGRGRNLRGLIEAAGREGLSCDVTVYSGDDAVGMFFGIHPQERPKAYQRFLRLWESSGITVKYTAIAHPDAAALIYDGRQNPYPSFERRYTREFGGESGLLNGQAMLGYDTIRVISTAIEGAAGGGGDPVNTSSVRQAFTQITGDTPVAGVSGEIGFDDRGNPHKELPLVMLRPSLSKNPQGPARTCGQEDTSPAANRHRSVCEVVLPAPPE